MTSIRFAFASLLFASLFLVINPLLTSLATSYFSKELKKDVELDYLAYVYALDAARSGLDDAQWQALLAQISEKSNLKVQTLDRPAFEQTTKLVIENVYDEELQTVIAKIQGKELIAFSALGVQGSAGAILNFIQYGLPLGLILVLFLLHSLWLQFRLSRLEHASKLIAQGLLSKRADTGLLAVGRVNYAFNQMAEKLECAFAQQRNMIRAVSHELKTPLFRLQLKLELLDVPPKNKNLVRELFEECEELEMLVHEILEFSKVEQFSAKTSVSNFDLRTLINEYIVNLEKYCNHPIIINCPNSVWIRACQTDVKRVLHNLIVNADKFAVEQIRVSLSLCNAQLLLTVEDDGIGIAEDKHELVFQAFFTVDESRSGRRRGAGLGLTIVKEILLNYDAGISVSRSELGGACLTVNLSPMLIN